MVHESRASDPEHGSDQVLVLGGAGFIGTRFAALLRQQKLAFQIGDLQPSKAFPDAWTQCDVTDLQSLLQIMKSCSAIVNLAAEHRDDVRPVSRYYETNVVGATRVCEAARAMAISKIVFTSSVAVYGFSSGPTAEDGPFNPFNPYGKTKLEAEGVYRTWASEDASRTLVIVRPTVVFGEGNRGNVYNLLRQIASGRFLMVGSGSNIKSMAYVGNLAAFLRFSLSLGPGVHIFNYVDLPDMTTKELVNYVLHALGRPERMRAIPLPLAMTAGYLLDAISRITGRRFPISAIRIRKFCESTQFSAQKASNTGFVAPYSLCEGLDRTIRSEFSTNSKPNAAST